MVSQSQAQTIQSVPRQLNRELIVTEQTAVSKQVIRKAKRGDEEAIGLIYETYVNRIFRYIAYRLNGDTKAAEDLTGDVMVRMVQDLPKYRITSAPFEAWLYRIASNLVIDYYRKHNKVIESNLSDSLTSDDPDPESHLVKEQMLNQLRLSLIRLKSEEQILLSLRFFERKSHEEVAQILGKSISSIRTMQHRALKRLADLMNLDNNGSNQHA